MRLFVERRTFNAPLLSHTVAVLEAAFSVVSMGYRFRYSAWTLPFFWHFLLDFSFSLARSLSVTYRPYSVSIRPSFIQDSSSLNFFSQRNRLSRPAYRRHPLTPTATMVVVVVVLVVVVAHRLAPPLPTRRT